MSLILPAGFHYLGGAGVMVSTVLDPSLRKWEGKNLVQIVTSGSVFYLVLFLADVRTVEGS